MPPDTNNTPEFTQNQVDRAIKEAVAKEQARYKTETLEGRLGTLADATVKLGEKVDRNHEGVLKKLDEVNHFKEFVNKRLAETEVKIDTGFATADQKATQLMAGHLSSPTHTLMEQHVAKPHLNATPVEVTDLQEMLREREIRAANRTKHNIFAKELSVKAGVAYAIIGSVALLAPGILWLIAHITLR